MTKKKISTKPKKTPKTKAPPPPCKACDNPDKFIRHTCGVAHLQDLLRF